MEAESKSQEVAGFETDVLSGIKMITDTRDFVDDDYLSALKKRRFDISKSFVLMADLFIDCYEILEAVAPKLKTEEEDYSEEVEAFLKHFELQAIYLRALLNNYTRGGSIGDYPLQVKLERNIEENRSLYSNLINVFFIIFGGDI